MRWVKRALLGLLALVVVAAGVAGWLWFRATREPEFLEGAQTVSVEEARGIVAKLTADPSTSTSTSSSTSTSRSTSARPYRLSLGEREVAAIVVANAPPAFVASVRALRVRIREDDLVAAGTLVEAPLEGQTAWIDVRPSVGAGGTLCLGFGGLHLGENDVPASLVEQLTGGRGMPRRRCIPPRGLLPGPLTRVEIEAGRVELQGYTRAP